MPKKEYPPIARRVSFPYSFILANYRDELNCKIVKNGLVIHSVRGNSSLTSDEVRRAKLSLLLDIRTLKEHEQGSRYV